MRPKYQYCCSGKSEPKIEPNSQAIGLFEAQLVWALKKLPIPAEFELASCWSKESGSQRFLEVCLDSRRFPVSFVMADLEDTFEGEGMAAVIDRIVKAVIDKMPRCVQDVIMWSEWIKKEEYARWKDDPEYVRLMNGWEEWKKTPEFAKIVGK